VLLAFFGTQLVITRAPSVHAQSSAGTTAQTQPQKKTGDFDFKNILTLVPAEAVALFLSSKGATPSNFAVSVWVWICFGICLLICFGIRIKASQPTNAKGLEGVNWALVFVSAIAFFIWAQATTDDPLMVPLFHGSLAGLVATAYGIIAPLFVPAVPRA
jgi:hypothetical protein